MSLQTVTYENDFLLESGDILPTFTLAYTTLGELNPDRCNVVWICHALTANSEPEEWWPGLVGKGKIFDPEKHFIVCANMLGSCYGSRNPRSINPITGHPYGIRFPLITIRDMVRTMDLLRIDLGIEVIHMITGGSMAGQQVLEWNRLGQEIFRHRFVLGTNEDH